MEHHIIAKKMTSKNYKGEKMQIKNRILLLLLLILIMDCMIHVPRHVVLKYMITRNDTMIKCFQMSGMAASPVAPCTVGFFCEDGGETMHPVWKDRQVHVTIW